MNKTKKAAKGFTLLELLVVVLIIGILASIALPQYQMAVTKAKVASILPLMRRWKDAMAEYKLQHGDYDVEDASYLDVNWPSDWQTSEGDPCGDSLECENDYWECMMPKRAMSGRVECYHSLKSGNMSISMTQADDPDEGCQGITYCYAGAPDAHKICKALGGTLIDGYENSRYRLN